MHRQESAYSESGTVCKNKGRRRSRKYIELQKADEELTVFPAWTDAGFINAGTDSACIVMGPGDLSVAHSADEHIMIKDLKNAALIYANIALVYCGAGI